MIRIFFKYATILIIILQGELLAQNDLSQKLYDKYSESIFHSIEHKRFSHSDLMNALNQFSNSKIIDISTAGYSVEGREIKLIKIGSGKINIMAWSQMHGDESTATMALLDLLNFFENDNEFSALKKEILEKVTLYIIPMLNPDGTERFRRRNEMDIDLNRDALRLQFPESKILKKIQEETNPKFAFNLHDQSTRYTVGNSYKVATISFLAPAYNYEKDINEVRKNSMQLISELTTNLEQFIPGHIAKYSDEFEPRAFGDNFVKWGSSLILIESGGWKNNYEKSFLRKMNFIAIVLGIESIANKNYENESIEIYDNIPENQKLLFDLLLRNVTIEKNNHKFIIDIGINQNEVGTSDKRDFYFIGEIEDIGDLSTFYGFDELDCTGFTIDTAMVYPEKYENFDAVKNIDIIPILMKGYSYVQVDSLNIKEKFSKIPINLIETEKAKSTKIEIGSNANFRLLKDNKVQFVCVNGFLFDVRSGKNSIQNGLIVK
ncbi:MAG: peptidase M14 [Bacteroidetes bacterium]|nr:peptidase M14 [Bacteroidota bacterium]MBU1116033.1 peptidase M14 [Bacteroidota bacterium]MBU1799199.1 peptidase M14 [Bacteroidota bacterium]